MDLYRFEDPNFDYIVLGTDILESVVAAVLSHRGRRVLVVDFDDFYSGTLKCFHTRDLLKLRQARSDPHPAKEPLVRAVSFTSDAPESFASLEQCISAVRWRGFSFEWESKWIVSDGPATAELVSVSIDDYVNFRALKELFVKLDPARPPVPLPLEKSKILDSQGLSLREKKKVYDIIVRLQKLHAQCLRGCANVNSIHELEKDIYSTRDAELVREAAAVLDADFRDLLRVVEKHLFRSESRLIPEPSKRRRRQRGAQAPQSEYEAGAEGLREPKAWKIICYCVCGFRLNISRTRGVSGREFLERFNLFVRSMGIHEKLPYVYPMYGAADITQVFSRIGAVYGGHFVMDKEMRVEAVRVGQGPSREEGEAGGGQGDKGPDPVGEAEPEEVGQAVEEKKGEPTAESSDPGETAIEGAKETEPAEQNEQPKGNSAKEDEQVKPVNKPHRLVLAKGAQKIELGFGKLICGPEYNKSVAALTGEALEVESETVMQTIHAVFKVSLSVESDKIPVVIVYPEGNEALCNAHMVRASVLGWNTKSTPLEFLYVNISFEQWPGADLDRIRGEVTRDVQARVERELVPQFHFCNERAFR